MTTDSALLTLTLHAAYKAIQQYVPENPNKQALLDDLSTCMANHIAGPPFRPLFTSNLWQAAVCGSRVAIPPENLAETQERAAGLVEVVETVDQDNGVYLVRLTPSDEDTLNASGDLELDNGDLWIYVALP